MKDIVYHKRYRPLKDLLTIIILTMITLGICIIGLISLITPKQYVLDVKFTKWTYTIQIQEYQAKEHSGWATPPSNAYDIEKEWKKDGVKSVGIDANGDTVYQDTYDWYYTYKYNEWVNTRKVVTTDTDKEPYFGEVVLKKPTDEMGLGEERILCQSKTYTVCGIINGTTTIKEIEVSESLWKEITNQDQLNYKQRKLGDPYEIHIAG